MIHAPAKWRSTVCFISFSRAEPSWIYVYRFNGFHSVAMAFVDCEHSKSNGDDHDNVIAVIKLILLISRVLELGGLTQSRRPCGVSESVRGACNQFTLQFRMSETLRHYRNSIHRIQTLWWCRQYLHPTYGFWADILHWINSWHYILYMLSSLTWNEMENTQNY